MRRGELIFNAIVFLGPLVLGFVVVWGSDIALVAPTTTFWGMVALFVLGFAMFLSAKLSVIRAGHLFSFGPRYMSRRDKALYFIGYGAMGLALLLVFFLAMAAAHIQRLAS